MNLVEKSNISWKTIEKCMMRCLLGIATLSEERVCQDAWLRDKAEYNVRYRRCRDKLEGKA